MLKKCKYIPILETERLILRELSMNDVEDLRKWLGREEIYTYWGRPASKGEKKSGAAVYRPTTECEKEAVS